MIKLTSVSDGPTRPPGAPRPPSVTATPYKGMGVVPARSTPPPIPAAAIRSPRVHLRIDTEPEPPRQIRSALVGRDVTVKTLAEIVRRAVEFQAPQFVTIVGNQGTGKTRLITELIAT